jgi:glutamate carboxypeptidase
MTNTIVTFLENKVESYLADLRALVSLDSGSRDQRGVNAVQDWLEARLARLGFRVERFPAPAMGDNLLATLAGSGQGRVMLLGHSDTVYPAGTATRRPLTLQGDKILGPGTCDMKAGLLAGLYAVEALQAIGFNDFATLFFLSVSDEETEPRHSIPLIQQTSRQADAVLTLEAARENGDIVTARKTMAWYRVEAFGRSAHAGVEPEKGRSALLALAHQAVALDRLNGLRPGVTVNIGVIEGGSLPSVVADFAKMRLDLRAWNPADLQAVIEAMQAQLEKPTVPEVRLTVMREEGSFSPAMERTPAVAELETMAQTIAGELGFPLKGARTGGASDASFAAAEGTPALDGLGPIGGLDHGPDEYIALSSIVPRTALLARLIMAITQKQKERD